MPEPKTLEDRIQLLNPDITASIRMQLQKNLNTIKFQDNYTAVIASMNRLCLQLLDELFSTVGRKSPSRNLNECICVAGSGDKNNAKTVGLRILPEEKETYLHTIRILCNKDSHAIEQSPFTSIDAENVLSSFLAVLQWFYCEYEKGPKLKTIYTSLPPQIPGVKTPSFKAMGIGFANRGEIFKGRNNELSTLRTLLNKKTTNFICVVGRGGYGKTSLISKVCNEIENGTFKDSKVNGHADFSGVIYESCRNIYKFSIENIISDLSEITDSGSEEIIRVWNDNLRPIEARIRFILSKLKKEFYLIVLDNLEDILKPEGTFEDDLMAKFIEQVLRTPNNIYILASSRRKVLLPENIADLTQNIVLRKGLSTIEGISLLRALDSEGILGLKDSEKKLLSETVRRCQGIPLALKRVAGILSRRPTFNLENFLQNEELFHGEILQNLISEYYNALTQEQRCTAQTLSIFNKPVTADAVKYILDPFLPTTDAQKNLDILENSFFVICNRENGTYELNDVDGNFLYDHIPTDDLYSKQILHRYAADFLHELSKEQNYFKTKVNLQFKLDEVHHRIQAGQHYRAGEILLSTTPYQSTYEYFHKTFPFCSEIVNSVEGGEVFLEEEMSSIQKNDIFIRIKCLHQSLSGDDFSHCGASREATGYYKTALSLSREIGNKEDECIQLVKIADLYADVGEIDKAYEHYADALIIARAINDRESECRIQNGLGAISLHLGAIREAIGYFEQALADAEGIRNQDLQGKSLGSLAKAFLKLGDEQKAIDYATKALEIAKEIGNKDAESFNLGTIGLYYAHINEMDKAFSILKEAITMDIDNGDLTRELLNEFTDSEQSVKLRDRMHVFLEELLKGIDKSEEFDFFKACILQFLGRIHLSKGDFENAKKYICEANFIIQGLVTSDIDISILIDLSRAHIQLNNIEYAIYTLYEAFDFSLCGGSQEIWSDTINIFSLISDIFHESLQVENLLKETKSEHEHIMNLILQEDNNSDYLFKFSLMKMNLGILHIQNGDVQLATQYLNEALEIAEETGNDIIKSLSFANLAYSHASVEEWERACDYYTRSMNVYPENTSKINFYRIYHGLAYSHHNMIHLTEATQNYKKSLECYSGEENYATYIRLGILDMEKKNQGNALENFNKGISLCKKYLENRLSFYRPQYFLALGCLATGGKNEALETYNNALKQSSAEGILKEALMDLKLLKRASPNLEGLQEAMSLLENHLE